MLLPRTDDEGQCTSFFIFPCYSLNDSDICSACKSSTYF